MYGFFWIALLYNVRTLFLPKGTSTSMGWYLYAAAGAEVTLLVTGLQALLPRLFPQGVLAFPVLCLTALDFLQCAICQYSLIQRAHPSPARWACCPACYRINRTGSDRARLAVLGPPMLRPTCPVGAGASSFPQDGMVLEAASRTASSSSSRPPVKKWSCASTQSKRFGSAKPA